MTVKYSSHVDNFCNESLPSLRKQPEYIFSLPELEFPRLLNCATELLDKKIDGKNGSRIALIQSEELWSYEELLHRSNQIAHVLIEDMGLRTGNRVLLRAPNNLALLVCWFAVLKAGGVAVTTMPLLRSADLIPVIEKAQISHALCDERLIDELTIANNQCKTLNKILTFSGNMNNEGAGEIESLAIDKPVLFDNVKTAADDVALIAFTSGTTGVPKGTMHFHRDILSMCICFSKNVLKPTKSDVFVGTPPLAFTFSLGALLAFPFYAGATSVLVEQPTPMNLLNAINRYRATICFTSATGYRGMLSDLDALSIRSLRKCISAGEHLSKSTFSEWKSKTGLSIINGIGTTEMTHIFMSTSEKDISPGSTGKIVPGYLACIMDENYQLVSDGKEGRLAVKGPTGCKYLNDKRQDDYVVSGWNITGDIFRRDKNGNFWYQGRFDDMIISAGYNISGIEVEEVLLDHPAILECAVISIPDENRGNLVAACLVLENGYDPNNELIIQIQQYTKMEIAPYKYPRKILFMDNLPKTQTGKIQHSKVKQMALKKLGM